ncbi:hypothetical protein OSTOST_25051 [Ostertagia ostertagi]
MRSNLSTFTADTASQLDVLGHDGDTLGMDSAQVGVFENKTNESWRASQPTIGNADRLEILSDFTDQTLERQFADEQLGRLLVTTDLTKSDGVLVTALVPSETACLASSPGRISSNITRFARRDRRTLVVVRQTRCLSSDALENVIHERVHDRHGFRGDTGVGVHLLEHTVDVDRVALLALVLPLLVSSTAGLLALRGFLGSLGGRLWWHR